MTRRLLGFGWSKPSGGQAVCPDPGKVEGSLRLCFLGRQQELSADLDPAKITWARISSWEPQDDLWRKRGVCSSDTLRAWPLGWQRALGTAQWGFLTSHRGLEPTPLSGTVDSTASGSSPLWTGRGLFVEGSQRDPEAPHIPCCLRCHHRVTLSHAADTGQTSSRGKIEKTGIGRPGCLTNALLALWPQGRGRARRPRALTVHTQRRPSTDLHERQSLWEYSRGRAQAFICHTALVEMLSMKETALEIGRRSR